MDPEQDTWRIDSNILKTKVPKFKCHCQIPDLYINCAISTKESFQKISWSSFPFTNTMVCLFLPLSSMIHACRSSQSLICLCGLFMKANDLYQNIFHITTTPKSKLHPPPLHHFDDFLLHPHNKVNLVHLQCQVTLLSYPFP